MGFLKKRDHTSRANWLLFKFAKMSGRATYEITTNNNGFRLITSKMSVHSSYLPSTIAVFFSINKVFSSSFPPVSSIPFYSVSWTLISSAFSPPFISVSRHSPFSTCSAFLSDIYKLLMTLELYLSLLGLFNWYISLSFSISSFSILYFFMANSWTSPFSYSFYLIKSLISCLLFSAYCS